MWTQRKLHGAVLLVWGLLWAAGVAIAGAGQTVADKAALDKMIFDALKDMHNRGADVYNGGDANGAYRLFQGGLLMAKPLLAHRPEVQQLIDQGMQNADRQASIPQRAKMLHETIETVRNHLKPATPATTPDTSKSDKAPAVLATPPPLLPSTLPPDPTMTAPPPAPQSVTPASAPPPAAGPPKRTLWDRLGSEANVTKIVDFFVNLSLEDPSINFSRNGTIAFNDTKEKELKQRLVGFISELSGGAVPYTGKGMAEAHQEMKIQGKEFDAFVKSLAFALQQNGVKPADAEELLEKVRATRKEVVTAPGG